MVKDGFLVPIFYGQGCKLVENVMSVNTLQEVVREKIFKELQEGRFEGPFTSPAFINFRISPLGIFTKKEPDSFRFIHHLSYPVGDSLNNQISKAMSSVTYTSFKDALVKPRPLGSGALIAKADIKSVFRLLPIHPDCFSSLGFLFANRFYFDKCLSMGCLLSNFYFKSFSTLFGMGDFFSNRFYLNNSLLG